MRRTPARRVGFGLVLERVQGLIPEPVQPAAQFAQAVGIDEIHAARAFGAVEHQAGILECLQVLRHRRAADRQSRGQFAHRARTLAQALEHAAAGGVGETAQGTFVSHDLR